MKMAQTFKTITFHWNESPTEVESADVVLGDGSEYFDDKYEEYDERIFFYFHDEQELELAKTGNADGIPFTVLEVE
jgi:hypothetical protein